METNELVYEKSKTIKIDGKLFNLKITLSLHDDCKNGECDFSTTYSMYKGRRESYGSDKLLLKEHFSEFKQIIDLHLSNFEGKPMFYIQNGFYHMGNQNDAVEYLRITENEFLSLKKAINIQVFEFLLIDLGIIDRWKNEANEAIKMLETLTNCKWVNPYHREPNNIEIKRKS